MTPWRLAGTATGLVWTICISWPAYMFLFWIYWPWRSKAIALSDDPYGSIAWEFFSGRIRAKNRKRNGVLTCAHCGSQRARIYDVHHIMYPRSKYPERFLWLPGLQLLCRGCHALVHEND